MPRAASPTPSRSKQWNAFGPSWMPAPISPSWLAFSSTSEAMPFCASASAVASPPMPPPAMRILPGTANDLLVVQPADLGAGEAEDARQDLIGVLAQSRCGLRPVARHSVELHGRGRDRIAADAGLVEHGEHRIVEHGVLVDAELAKRLVRRRQRARFLERGADVCRAVGRHPRLDHGDQLGARVPAVGLDLEVDALVLLDPREGIGKTASLRQCLEMTVGEDADHHVLAVFRAEVATEGAEDLVAEARP